MNYGVYGNYRKIRNASWKCLIDCNITSLPVSLDEIITKSDIHVKYEKSPNILEYDEKGASILTQEGKWFIVINSTLSYEERRFTVAHEIGHIFLGHMLTPIDDIAFLTSGRKPAEESSADNVCPQTSVTCLRSLGIGHRESQRYFCTLPYP